MDRSISVALIPGALRPGLDLSQTCSVVIDVLRATSVMATAGKAGVGKILTCGQTEQAKQVAARLPRRPLLCGERHCKPIDGFDLGNSPAEYTPDVVAGRDMVLTTTNGTQAINAVLRSRRLLISSFLNLDATIRAIAGERAIQIVCAGTNGEVSYEDVLLAGVMVERLGASNGSDQIDDSARIAQATWRQGGPRLDRSDDALTSALRLSLGGRNLMAVGFDADVVRCAKLNSINGVVERIEASGAVFAYRT